MCVTEEETRLHGVLDEKQTPILSEYDVDAAQRETVILPAETSNLHPNYTSDINPDSGFKLTTNLEYIVFQQKQGDRHSSLRRTWMNCSCSFFGMASKGGTCTNRECAFWCLDVSAREM